jgi:excisionase family DNA binding protein
MRASSIVRPALIGIDDVAERLGVSTRYVRRLVAERRIEYLKVGRLLRFDSSAVDAWIRAGEVSAFPERGAPHPKRPKASTEAPLARFGPSGQSW